MLDRATTSTMGAGLGCVVLYNAVQWLAQCKAAGACHHCAFGAVRIPCLLTHCHQCCFRWHLKAERLSEIDLELGESLLGGAGALTALNRRLQLVKYARYPLLFSANIKQLAG